MMTQTIDASQYIGALDADDVLKKIGDYIGISLLVVLLLGLFLGTSSATKSESASKVGDDTDPG